MRLESIGKSYEGRDIWLVTVTNAETGPDLREAGVPRRGEHPRDRGHRLHGGAAPDPSAAHALRIRRAGHPRARHADVLRAAPPQPGRRRARPGRPAAVRALERAALSPGRPAGRAARGGPRRRRPDPDDAAAGPQRRLEGASRRAAADDPPRPGRGPGDGEFYRLLREGTIRNFDGVTIKVAPPPGGPRPQPQLPLRVAPEVEQRGAGPYPDLGAGDPRDGAGGRRPAEHHAATSPTTPSAASTCAPTRATQTSTSRPNDLRAYKLLGEEATKLTGYPAVSVFHDFKYDPNQAIKGSAHDWLYDHVGVFSWTTEFWSPQRRAGIDGLPVHRVAPRPLPEDDLRLLAWADERWAESGYVDWYPFEHPQLGPVELGGWDTIDVLGERARSASSRTEIAPHTEWALWHLLVSPRLEVRSLDVEPRRGRALPGSGSWSRTPAGCRRTSRRRRSSGKAVRPLEAEFDAARGRARGRRRGAHRGRPARRPRAHAKRPLVGHRPGNERPRKLEWVVEAPAGGTLGVEARHPRAGVVRRELELTA